MILMKKVVREYKKGGHTRAYKVGKGKVKFN